MSNNKRNVYIGVGVIVALSIGAGTIYTLQTPNEKASTIDEQLNNMDKQEVFAYTENGVVSLYDTQNGKLINTFDLKTLSTGKEITIDVVMPQVVKPQVVKPKPVETKPKEVLSYKDFLQVAIDIKDGDTAWDIQTGLTPKRNPVLMLKYLREINKDVIHPIYPGDKRIFLKEKDGSEIDKVIKEPKEVEKSKEIEKQETEPVVKTEKKVLKKVDENTKYLYSKSHDFTTLYAYNDIEEAFYRVSIKDNKIEGEILYATIGLNDVKDFKVVDNKLYVMFDKGMKLREINLSDTKQVKEYNLQGVADLFVVRDGSVFYTYKDRLGKINLSNGEETSVLLGDKSTDYIYTNDNLYILNEFGLGADNSILIKVNPSNLKIDNLVELKTNKNIILSEKDDTDKILVGQVNKTVDVDKNVTKEQVVLPVKSKNLQKGLFVKDVPFNEKALEYEDFIYQVEDGVISVYSATNGKLSQEIDVEKEVTNVMPLN